MSQKVQSNPFFSNIFVICLIIIGCFYLQNKTDTKLIDTYLSIPDSSLLKDTNTHKLYTQNDYFTFSNKPVSLDEPSVYKNHNEYTRETSTTGMFNLI